MTRQVQCAKLKQAAPGLMAPPYPGPLGERIFNEISQDAWNMWQQHQTILINEYRLDLSDANARNFLKQQMIKFLFEDESQLPDAYTDPNKT